MMVSLQWLERRLTNQKMNKNHIKNHVVVVIEVDKIEKEAVVEVVIIGKVVMKIEKNILKRKNTLKVNDQCTRNSEILKLVKVVNKKKVVMVKEEVTEVVEEVEEVIEVVIEEVDIVEEVMEKEAVIEEVTEVIEEEKEGVIEADGEEEEVEIREEELRRHTWQRQKVLVEITNESE